MALTKIPASLLDTSSGFDLQGNITLGDNEKIRLGNGPDLDIFHDGSNSYIEDLGDGVLFVKASGGIYFNGKTTDEPLARFIENGAVNLYYNNDLRIATSSAGATVDGTLTVTGDLDITGNVNSYNITDLDVTDKTITLGAGQTEANSGGSGIIIDGSSASILWDETNDEWDFNKAVNIRKDTSATTNELLRLSNSAGSTTDGVKLVMEVANTSGNGGEIGTVRDDGSFNPYMYFSTSAGVGSSPVERMRIDSNGLVHLGNNINTDHKGLHIYKSTNDSYTPTNFNNESLLRLNVPNAEGNYAGITYTHSGTTEFFTGLARVGATSDITDYVFQGYNGNTNSYQEYMRIDSSGNVGIGTSSPSTTLHVTSAAGSNKSAIITRTTGSEAVNLSEMQDYNALQILNKASGSYLNFAGNASNTQIQAQSDGSTAEDIALNPYGGNVGIGETSPSKLLHIASNTNYEGMLIKGAGHKQFQIESTQSSKQVLTTYISNSANYSIGIDTDNAFIFRDGTPNTERMRINSNGTLLVSTITTSGLSNGTTNYGHSFGGGQQVNATNNDTNLILNMSNGSSNPHVQFRSDGGNTGNISTNGSAVSYNTGSDYRLKENVISLKDGLDRLNKLNPVQFDWKESQETDEGFIAHEVQEIVPYVVKGEKDGEEIQTMDYAKLTPLLVKAIQEQQTIIDDLKSRIETLEG